MDVNLIANQLILSVLLGGAYALFAIGLSLSAGVLRLINLAHGDLIVLFSYLAFSLIVGLGLGAGTTALILIPASFFFGLALQRLLLRRVSNGLLPRLLVTFGLSTIIQNGLLLWFGADPRQIPVGGLEAASVPVTANIQVGVLPLLMFAVAVFVILALELLLHRTTIGAQIRAVSENLESANMIGLPTDRILGISFGLVGLTIAISAAFMGAWTSFDPTFGPLYLLTSFEVVILGGLGRLWGMLVGGVIIALAQNLGGQIDAAWQALAGHLAFILIFMIRPNGLFAARSS